MQYRPAPAAAKACQIVRSSLPRTRAHSRTTQLRCERAEADKLLQPLRRSKLQVLPQQRPVHVTEVNFHDWIVIDFSFHSRKELTRSTLLRKHKGPGRTAQAVHERRWRI